MNLNNIMLQASLSHLIFRKLYKSQKLSLCMIFSIKHIKYTPHINSLKNSIFKFGYLNCQVQNCIYTCGQFTTNQIDVNCALLQKVCCNQLFPSLLDHITTMVDWETHPLLSSSEFPVSEAVPRIANEPLDSAVG